MAKKRIKTSSAKAKGRNLQNYTAQKIAEITRTIVEKDGDVEGRTMGSSGTDVILRGKAKELFLFDVECKARSRMAIYDFIKQAISNQKSGRNWLLVLKKDRDIPVVVLDAEVFFNLYKKIIDNGK